MVLNQKSANIKDFLGKKVVKILFVCMGNICRSPTAEGVFRKLILEKNLEQFFEIDSAGTHSYHIGSAPDSRPRLKQKNIM